jgi:hypothetical protein
MAAGLLLLLQAAAGRGHRRHAEASADHVRLAAASGELDGSAGWSKKKWDEVNAATAAEAHERQTRISHGLPPLPLFPTHTTMCGGRRCRQAMKSRAGQPCRGVQRDRCPIRQLCPAMALLPRTRCL